MKPIIATSLKGVVLRPEPWDDAHVTWFKDAAEELQDPSVAEYGTIENWWPLVDEIMLRLFPDQTKDARTRIAREKYHQCVVKNIIHQPHSQIEEVVTVLAALKDTYRIASITTNIHGVFEILKAGKLENLYDSRLVTTTQPPERDEKQIVFNRFIAENGKPAVYIGGDREESYAYCREHSIPAIFYDCTGKCNIEGVTTVRSGKELRAALEKILSAKS